MFFSEERPTATRSHHVCVPKHLRQNPLRSLGLFAAEDFLLSKQLEENPPIALGLFSAENFRISQHLRQTSRASLGLSLCQELKQPRENPLASLALLLC